MSLVSVRCPDGSIVVGVRSDLAKDLEAEGYRIIPSRPKLQPGDEHDTMPPRGLFGDEQAAPGSDD